MLIQSICFKKNWHQKLKVQFMKQLMLHMFTTWIVKKWLTKFHKLQDLFSYLLWVFLFIYQLLLLFLSFLSSSLFLLWFFFFSLSGCFVKAIAEHILNLLRKGDFDILNPSIFQASPLPLQFKLLYNRIKGVY